MSVIVSAETKSTSQVPKVSEITSVAVTSSHVELGASTRDLGATADLPPNTLLTEVKEKEKVEHSNEKEASQLERVEQDGNDENDDQGNEDEDEVEDDVHELQTFDYATLSKEELVEKIVALSKNREDLFQHAITRKIPASGTFHFPFAR